MPHYDLVKADRPSLDTAKNAAWVETGDLAAAIREIERQNLDTNEGCKLAKAKMTAMPVKVGKELFKTSQEGGKRFPDDDSYYIPDSDPEFARTWNQLARALESRETSIAKDCQVGRQQGAPGTGVTAEKTGQATQDNKVAIKESLNRLREVVNNNASKWDRDIFERKMGLTWVEAAVQAPPR